MYLKASLGPFAVSYLNFTTNMASICVYNRNFHSDEDIDKRI